MMYTEKAHYKPRGKAELVEWFRMYRPDWKVKHLSEKRLYAIFYRIMQDARE